MELNAHFEKELAHGSSYSFDLSKVLGIGGEAIVFRKNTNGKRRAIKVAPYDNIRKPERAVIFNAIKNFQNQTGKIENDIDQKYLKLTQNCSEFSSTTMMHENLIAYYKVIIDIVDQDIMIVIGKFLLYLASRDL